MKPQMTSNFSQIGSQTRSVGKIKEILVGALEVRFFVQLASKLARMFVVIKSRMSSNLGNQSALCKNFNFTSCCL